MDKIKIVGAREHNLKNINVEVPRDKLTVITGISGSGKSSLAFDTIYAEGQRRYVESLSSFARQFLGNLEKPDVDYIEGLSPSISIDQKTAGMNPRSTVGTMSEIYDYLRLLFTRIGVYKCSDCGEILVSEEIKVKKKNKFSKNFQIQKQKIYLCPKCKKNYPPLTMSSFSFNSPDGACPDCQGLGRKKEIDPDLVFPNMRLTLAEGAIRPWSRTTSQSNWYNNVLRDLSKKYKFSLDTPVSHLTKKNKDIILYGDSDFEGVIPNLEKKYRETDSDYIRNEIEKYMIEKTCPACNGKRLRKEVLGITVLGKNIIETSALTIDESVNYFNSLDEKLNAKDKEIVKQIVKEVKNRLKLLLEVGVGYLSLDRSADTLAGGEAQRIRLATQIGSNLTGILYILDEPSIGLHQRDQERLLKTLFKLKELSNTVIIVEHDKSTIMSADHVIDIGPGAGEFGGEIIAQGSPQDVAKSKGLTGQYLSGKKQIIIPAKRRKGDKFIIINPK